MGNESLPPPPPPGEPPHVPPTPPVPPPPPGGQFPPGLPTPPQQPPVPPPYPPQQYPPTPQVPPTQGYPAQPYPQPAPAYVPGGQPPITPKKSKNGLYILAAIVAIAAIVGGVLAFGGKDKKTQTLGGDDTTKPTLEVTTTASTVEATTATTDGGLVITAPATTEPAVTSAPVGTDLPSDVQKVVDSTSTFSAVLPSSFDTNTDPITTNGISFSHISGSANLDQYVNDNDTFGITLLTANTSDLSSPADLLNKLDPGQSVCASRVADQAHPTTLGTAALLQLDGCGTGGAKAKIILVVEIPASGKTLIAVSQGPGPASGDLLTFTQAVFETVVYG